jgi:hypothetical protein
MPTAEPVVLIPLLGVLAFGALRCGSALRYRRLARLQAALAGRFGRFLDAARVTVPPDCFRERLCAFPAALAPQAAALLRAAAERAVAAGQDGGKQRPGAAERSYIPGHKAGGTVSYAALHTLAPELVAFYHCTELRRLCSEVVGADLVPTPINDQSSCSLLVYQRMGDHIGWHYDHDFYRGRHFTVLLTLVNERRGQLGTSSARLEANIAGEVRVVPTPSDTLVIFEGARVRHRVTRLGEDERRILLSMTFCTDPRASLLQGLLRRCKDTAYYGVRALWS